MCVCVKGCSNKKKGKKRRPLVSVEENKTVSPSKEVDNFPAFHIAKQKLAPTKKHTGI